MRFGRYQLHERIGRGGMGEIFRGTLDGVEGFSKPIVIKRILSNLAEDEHFVSMFIDEAKLSAHLVHANVVQIHELGAVDGQLFIAMEYVDGHDLSKVLRQLRRKGQRLPVEIAAYIISCVCQGLNYAHHKTDGQGHPLNIIHRDVSPSNVLISWEGEVKVADFGIAKAATQTVRTRTGSFKGKYCYISAEQLEGKPDRRSDIYAAGVILWELLVGQKLFWGESELQIMSLVTSGQVPRANELADVPAALQGILDKTLAFLPEDRFQSADELADALTTFIFQHGKKAGTRELSSLMHRLFKPIETSSGIVQLKEGISVSGMISRVAATPRRSAKDGYFSRGLELVEEGTGKKIIIIFPDFLSPELYDFPSRCRVGEELNATQLLLNNELKDGSRILLTTVKSEFIFEVTPSTSGRAWSAVPEEPVDEKYQSAIEALVAAAGGVVDHTVVGEPKTGLEKNVGPLSERPTEPIGPLHRLPSKAKQKERERTSSGAGGKKKESRREKEKTTAVRQKAKKKLNLNLDTAVVPAGYLEATTDPPAKVLVDGDDTGESTPLQGKSKLPLIAGPHTITFVAEKRRFTCKVQITPGTIARINIKLPM